MCKKRKATECNRCGGKTTGKVKKRKHGLCNPCFTEFDLTLSRCCTKCNTWKPREDFPKDNLRKTGKKAGELNVARWCLDCKRAQQRAHAATPGRKKRVKKNAKRHYYTEHYQQKIKAEAQELREMTALLNERKRLKKLWAMRREIVDKLNNKQLKPRPSGVYDSLPTCTCDVCKREFYFDEDWRHHQHCSDVCLDIKKRWARDGRPGDLEDQKKKKERKKQARRKQRRRGTRKHIQRAKKFGVPYEPIDKSKVFRADGYKCRSCGINVIRTRKPVPNQAHLDHITPLSRGGAHYYSNVQTLCRSCNQDKRDMTMEEWESVKKFRDESL